MKRLFSIFLALFFNLCLVSAQTDATAPVLVAIQTDTAYLHTMVCEASEYQARLEGHGRLLKSVKTNVPGCRLPEETIVQHIKEIIIKNSGQPTVFFYVRKSDLLQPAAAAASEGSPTPVQTTVQPCSTVSFAFSPESEVKAPKRHVEDNITALLNAVNTAYSDSSKLDVARIDMTPDCRKSMEMGWQHKPYYCVKSRNVRPCLYASGNMNVRDIPVYSPNDEVPDRHLSISFNAQGQIECVRFAAELASYEKIMRKGGKEITEATDVARRTSILSFVENYRQYYVDMDVQKIENIFAEDAIIITGSVVEKAVKQPDSRKIVKKKRVIYNRKTKEEYIAALRKLFSDKEEVSVIFDDIRVVQDPAHKDIYGVTLLQHWQTKNKKNVEYKDLGYLFLLWDFQDPEKPMIHARTWQPKEIIKAEEEIFSLNSFQYEDRKTKRK